MNASCGEIHLPELAHPLLPLLLLIQQLALPRSAAAIAPRRGVLAQRPHRLPRDDRAADGGLDSEPEWSRPSETSHSRPARNRCSLYQRESLASRPRQSVERSPIEQLRAVWKQTVTPVLFRRPGKGHKLLVRLPFRADNRFWLSEGRRMHPIWDGAGKRWEVPQAWFNDLVSRCLTRFGEVYVIQPFREQEVCAPACWNALGEECQCSCMGKNHGMNSPAGRWKVVSETFATRWDDEEIACRLIRRG